MKYIFSISVFVLLFTSVLFAKENRAVLLFVTNKGNMTVELYNETPLHRDNFLKLVQRNFFDNTLFHRVIKDFMIQGGDPESKNAPKGRLLGNGGPGYEIDAEFVPTLIHKKGVLAAARNGDKMNPKHRSSGSQFYLVQGHIFSEEELNQREIRKNMKMRKSLIVDAKQKYKIKIDSLVQLLKTGKDTLALPLFLEEQNKRIDSIIFEKGFHFTEQQKQFYTTIGGVPHLDGAYTVFGEITKGLEVVDTIANVATDKRDRPLEDVVVKTIHIIKKYK